MKQILTSSIVAFAIMLLVAGCETDPNSSTSAPDIRPMRANGGGGSQENPDPAIAFMMTTTSKGKTYDAIGVIDSGGGNLATIYKASATTTVVKYPKWSPEADRIAFVQYDEQNDGFNHQSIYLRDVSVSGGKVSGSNTRSIYTPSSSVSRTEGISWSPIASQNKIAFSTRDNTTGKVQVVSAAGGTPTVLYQSNPDEFHIYLSLDYSPDGSKIAFIDHLNSNSSPNPEVIRIIDASSGALLESISLGTVSGACNIAWSRSGSNVIAFTADLGSMRKLYYVNPTSGSTPWTNDVAGSYPTWSPTNTSIITAMAPTSQSSSLQKIVTGTTTTSSISTGASSEVLHPDWKR